MPPRAADCPGKTELTTTPLAGNIPRLLAFSNEISDICTPNQPHANFSPFARRGRMRLITLIGVRSDTLGREYSKTSSLLQRDIGHLHTQPTPRKLLAVRQTRKNALNNIDRR